MSIPLTKKTVGLGAIWSVIHQSANQLLSLAVFLITARFVSKEAFGVMAVCMVVLDSFKQVWSDSLGTALAAKNAPTDEDYNAAFILILSGSMLFGAVLFASAPLLSMLLSHDDITGTLRWFTIALIAQGSARTHEAWLMKHMQFRTIAFRSIIAICLGGGIGVIMAVRGLGIQALITQQLVTSIIGTAWLWLATEWRPSVRTSLGHMASLLHFSKHISVTSFTNILSLQADVFFTSYYLGVVATGIYNAGKRITYAFNSIFFTALNNVIINVLSHVSAEAGQSGRGFIRAVQMTAFCTSPLYAGLAVVAPDLIQVALGKEWADAAPVLSLLSISMFVSTIGQQNINVILVKQKPGWTFWLTVSNAIGNVLALALVGHLGMLWIAGAVAARSVLLLPLSTACALKLEQLSVARYTRALLPSIVAAAVMAAFVWYLRESVKQIPIVSLAICVPLGAMFYLASSWAINRSAISDLLAFASSRGEEQKATTS